MCGIVALAGTEDGRERVERAVANLQHRGPDGRGAFVDETSGVTLGHTRLSIIDTSDAGAQPMMSVDGRFALAFNGELYNYVELRAELSDHAFRTATDTEVALAAWAKWGTQALHRFVGMFAFVVWDRETRTLTAVRDRFGVKPLLFSRLGRDGIAIASEVGALHALGIAAVPDTETWATYLEHGLSDHDGRTFWRGIEQLDAGCLLTWKPDGTLVRERWYDLASRTQTLDDRSADVVKEEYSALLRESIRYRFRADVPVGINLSGGTDSSLLLALVNDVLGRDNDAKAFTFTTGDPEYDELPWVRQMLAHTHHPLYVSQLTAEEVPDLARRTAAALAEPYGGIPTLAYAKLFKHARTSGVLVLLDGQGMDEQWAGYDYYRQPSQDSVATVQGSRTPSAQAACLSADLRRLARPFEPPSPYSDRLRNLQFLDLHYRKLPRALRFNDRVSMASSTELREPFLDHRLVELAVRQPADRKIDGSTGKVLLREIASKLVPPTVHAAPKRPVQTPQREWLRGPLRPWATDVLEHAFAARREWFDVETARRTWREFVDGKGDNSFWIWQWLSVAWNTGVAA
jgi:asparagine synthase (glutamine-hydrolysing)